jgi:hypothetical protein
MLFMWIPVPGTTTPDPAPIDAVIDAALPRSSTTAMCVVPGASAGSVPLSAACILLNASSMFSSE